MTARFNLAHPASSFASLLLVAFLLGLALILLCAAPTHGQVDDHPEALRGLRGLGIGVGLGDQFVHIPVGTLECSQRLDEERIPHLLDVVCS